MFSRVQFLYSIINLSWVWFRRTAVAKLSFRAKGGRGYRWRRRSLKHSLVAVGLRSMIRLVINYTEHDTFVVST